MEREGEEKPKTLTALAPVLLCVSKAVMAEAQPVLYGDNDFVFEDTVALHAFLANIGSTNVASLTDITVNGWGTSAALRGSNHPALTLLVPAVKLERFLVNCKIHYGNEGQVARQLFKDGHHWLEARGERAVMAVDMAEKFFTVNKSTFSAGEGWQTSMVKGDVEILRSDLRVMSGLPKVE